MPRIRWAQRCRAKPDGQVCGGWAIRGGYVCQAHGGSLRRTKDAARLRLVQLVMEREFRKDYAAWGRRLAEFRHNRIETTSRLLGIPPEQVDRFDIVHCHVLNGVPPLDHEAPGPVWRRDRRVQRWLDNPR